MGKIKLLRDKKGRFIKGSGGNDYWKGKKRPASFGINHSKAMKGKVCLEETKKKIGAANKIALKGKKQSKENFSVSSA